MTCQPQNLCGGKEGEGQRNTIQLNGNTWAVNPNTSDGKFET